MTQTPSADENELPTLGLRRTYFHWWLRQRMLDFAVEFARNHAPPPPGDEADEYLVVCEEESQ